MLRMSNALLASAVLVPLIVGPPMPCGTPIPQPLNRHNRRKARASSTAYLIGTNNAHRLDRDSNVPTQGQVSHPSNPLDFEPE